MTVEIYIAVSLRYMPVYQNDPLTGEGVIPFLYRVPLSIHWEAFQFFHLIKLFLRFKIVSVREEKRDCFKLAVSPGGGLVAKSCLTLATPWTVACQAPLSF